MKKYIAIGHFAESDYITCVACTASNMKNFRDDCGGNDFIPWVILSMKKWNLIKNSDTMEIYEEIKKLSSNWRRWNDITDYIDQCKDIIESRLARA